MDDQKTFVGVEMPWPLIGPVTIGDRDYNVVGAHPHYLWPVSVALASSLAAMRPQLGVCCDVGCGLGLGGIVASQFADSVWMIDREDACNLARANCETNGVKAIVLPVPWDKLHAPFDSIIGSEILYRPHDISGLAEFIRRNWTRKGPCLFANATNVAGEEFERQLAVCGLTATKSGVTQFGISYFLWEITP